MPQATKQSSPWPVLVVMCALGLALLGFARGSGYPSLLPAFLLWGIGLGTLTPGRGRGDDRRPE